MNGENINKSGEGLCILIAPLDWGLGHATRCIPIIYALIDAGASVLIATDGANENILKKEFPNLQIIPLKGYKIKYSKSKRWFLLQLISQFPAIKGIVQYENKLLKKIAEEHKIDAVISDNRLGLNHTNIPTVYITHQLHIETGRGWMNKIAQQFHYYYINRYNECWVPDVNGNKNLAGNLSHPKKLPAIPVKYLGVLSRFKKKVLTTTTDLMVLLSGPEPQRSIFENIILKQLKDFSGSVVFVRGLPAQTETLTLSQNIQVYNHLPAAELSLKIQQSKIVLARAGYSTIMDLATLQQKAVLVPTPGQSEQEYLAVYLKEQQLFYSCSQENFKLSQSLHEAGSFYQNEPKMYTAFNREIVYSWLDTLQKAKALQ